jgi:hypothetical protein
VLLALASVTACSGGAGGAAARSRNATVMPAVAAAGESATISALGFDPANARLERIELSLANAAPATNPHGFDYIVVAGERSATFWHAEHLGNDPATPGRVLLALTPADKTHLPTLGAHVLIKAVDRASGTEIVLASGTAAKRTGAFVDPALTAFADAAGGSPMPAGWGPSGTARTRGTVGKFSDGGIAGVAVGLVAPHPGWNSFGLAQNVPLHDATAFSIRVWPTRDCDGSTTAPTLVSGVALSDPVGHVAQFCISSKIAARQVGQFSDGRQLIAVYPGRLRAWNVLDVDVRALRSLFRLYPAKDGTIVVTLGIALHATAGSVDADRIAFSDITAR